MLMGTAVGKGVANHLLLPIATGVDLFFIIDSFLMMWTTQDFDGPGLMPGPS